MKFVEIDIQFILPDNFKGDIVSALRHVTRYYKKNQYKVKKCEPLGLEAKDINHYIDKKRQKTLDYIEKIYDKDKMCLCGSITIFQSNKDRTKWDKISGT